MSGGYQRGRGDGLDALVQQVAEIRRRLRELEIPTGTQNASLVAQVQAKLAELDATVEALVAEYVDSFTYDTGEINALLAGIEADYEALVASPGAIAPSSVVTSGHIVSGGNVTADGGMYMDGPLKAMSVYSTIGTSDYRAVWVTGVDGQLLYVPSSSRFKRDIHDAMLDPIIVLALRLVTFRYIAAVEESGDDAKVEIGLIAEEVHALGLSWLVDYDEEGLPFGVKFEKLSFGLLAVAQNHEARIAAIEAALA